jgi:uncharacterized protein YndB with AHSA1/START domain
MTTTLTVRREIEATAEELFDAWLDPESLAEWMSPGDITHAVVKLDAREGGAFEIVMHNSCGTIPHTGVYRVIDRPQRLVFTWGSPHTGPGETLVTVEFRAGKKATEVVLTHEHLPTGAVQGHTKGWTDILKELDQHVGAARATT